MTESELLELSTERHLAKHQVSESAECYGMGAILREYAYYPQKWPLFIGTDHGPSQRDIPTKLELESDFPIFLFHSNRLCYEWEKIKKKRAYTVLSPFVFYRRKKHINQNVDAKGTICFPAHSTDLIYAQYDVMDYIKQLKSLPEDYHPIGICMYYKDIQLGRHKLFLENGFDVYTAGHIYDERFVDRFYQIIRNFKYSSSSHLGSYAFYCAEMGIPFFLMGPSVLMQNNGDPNCKPGSYKSQDEYKQLLKAHKIFSTTSDKVTDVQMQFLDEELGLSKHISRFYACTLFYYALVLFIFKKIILKLHSIKLRFK